MPKKSRPMMPTDREPVWFGEHLGPGAIHAAAPDDLLEPSRACPLWAQVASIEIVRILVRKYLVTLLEGGPLYGSLRHMSLEVDQVRT